MNCRNLAVKIINRVVYEKAYSNIILSNELDKSDLEDNDKALLTEIVYGVLRRKKTLDIIISNFVKDIAIMNRDILAILEIAIFQMRFLDKIPEYAAVNEAVESAKAVSAEDSKLVNAVLRNYSKNPDDIVVKGNKIDEIAYKFSFEPWMIRLLIKQYGEEKAKKIMASLNEVPTVTVRVNSLKAEFEDVLDKLIESSVDASEGAICPEAIQIKNGRSVKENPLFSEGLITVQDESAMSVAPLLDLDEDNLTVADLCAAPGTKTTHISEILNNKGTVIACDNHENKLSLIEDNAKRLGIDNIKVLVNDAEKFNPEFVDKFDRILIDVPCSGIGIIRKKPEIKWSKKRKDLREIAVRQKNILENSWKYLKDGGIMIYSTCTLNKEENDDNIDWFLKSHEDSKSVKIFIGRGKNLEYGRNDALTILPSSDMDGFYIAKLQKIAGEK
ncbi:16S rRNA (cytosine(967)-C(5))-methyltransferase RsmB [Clostridium sp. BJN0001]|uniref:16S rRNA (cytosine(967)-C(5))-methyltransferase RsmB n=1 Tax=Clostridium sp. BJN0001 TaxID=2930219 RepID=UPI001FD15B8C|nr:16S rRNA (cytosine(967)-C(5))-methyltransferase RsmB [Clostridium sp. BJN0001]